MLTDKCAESHTELQGAPPAAVAADTDDPTAPQSEKADAFQDAERLQRQQDVPASTSDAADAPQPSVLCARCYSLVNYG